MWTFIISDFFEEHNTVKLRGDEDIMQTSVAVQKVRKEVSKCDEVQRAINCKL